MSQKSETSSAQWSLPLESLFERLHGFLQGLSNGEACQHLSRSGNNVLVSYVLRDSTSKAIPTEKGTTDDIMQLSVGSLIPVMQL